MNVYCLSYHLYFSLHIPKFSSIFLYEFFLLQKILFNPIKQWFTRFKIINKSYEVLHEMIIVIKWVVFIVSSHVEVIEKDSEETVPRREVPRVEGDARERKVLYTLRLWGRPFNYNLSVLNIRLKTVLL